MISCSYNTCLEYLGSISSWSKMTVGITRYLPGKWLLCFKQSPPCDCSLQSHPAEVYWATMCIVLIHFGAKKFHYSLPQMFCEQKWLLQLSLGLLFYVIVSNFWDFDFCTSKFGSGTQIHCLDSKDFSLNRLLCSL